MDEPVDSTHCPLVVCFLTEFLATGLYIIIGCMAYMAGKPEFGPLMPAFSFGFAKMGVLQIAVHLTPAYVNPGVSVGMFILNKLDWRRLITYLAGEYLGAIVGYAILRLGYVADNNYFPCNLEIHPDFTLGQAFVIELLASFILMMAVAGASDERLFADADSTSLRLGLIVTGLFFAVEPYTGCCMNPARSVPYCLFSHRWTNHWLHHIAPYTGAIIAALVYKFVFDHTFKYSIYSICDQGEDS